MIAARAPGVRTAEAPKVAQAVPAHTVSASRLADASASRAPFSAPFEDPRVSLLLPPRVQRETRVSSPGDPAEREAVATARRVMRMAAPSPPPSTSRPSSSARTTLNASPLLRAPVVHRATSPAPATIHRAPAAAPRARAGPPRADDVMPEIRGEMGGGTPLPASVRGYLEPRFRAEFGVVRVHTNEKAASLAARLAARAFTFGKHIFFGRGEFRPNDQEGMELIAHELTHTIQQKEVVQRQEAVAVTERNEPQVQRLGFDDILDWLADKANAIPGFRMFTIVLGVNPVNMSKVDRSAANVLRAVVEFIPGGNLITRALDSYGIFDKVGNWIEGQIRTLGMVGSAFKQAIGDFIDSLGWRDLFRPGSVWNRAKRIFTDPIDKLISFAAGFIGGILDFLREAVLRPLAKLAEGTRAYDLLRAVLGKDPITGDPVEQSADVLIGGFMKLIGQEEVYENIKKGNAVSRAFAWFKGVLSGAIAFVTAVPGLIISTLKSITIQDFLPITNLFGKVGRAFGGFIGSFLSWGLDQVLGLLQIIFEVVAPRAVPYLQKAAGAFKQIIRNPIGFIGNLVRAGVLGFRQFSGRFLSHLGKSLVEWLTGSMKGANIYIPQALNLREIVKFVLSVLGLTWANIRGKLVKAVGEGPVAAMEATFAVVKTLVTQGPAAAWEQIKEGIGNLQEMVMGQIMAYVRNQIVVQTIQKLVSSLNPAGAFIQAVIAIYNTVMFFIERLKQIGQVVASFIDSIAAIASGAVGAAANRVETTMAGLLTLVISFLARLAGLGKVSDEVVKVVNRIRQPVDKALDRVVDWIVAQARKAGRFLAGKARGVAQRVAGWWRERKQFTARGTERHTLYFEGEGAGARLIMATTPVRYTSFINGLVTTANKTNALAIAGQIETARASGNTTSVWMRERLNALAAETALLLAGAAPGAGRYPGSNVDPGTRPADNLQLWKDVDPRNAIPEPGEGARDKPVRALLARTALLGRYSGVQLSRVRKLLEFEHGQRLRPIGQMGRHEGKGHTISRHVLNRSGQIGTARDLALRVLLNAPGNPNKAGAFLDRAGAAAAVAKAVGKRADGANWEPFRTSMIAAPGHGTINITEPDTPPSLVYTGPPGVPLPLTALPNHLAGKSYYVYNLHTGAVVATYTFIATTVTRKLDPSDTRGTPPPLVSPATASEVFVRFKVDDTEVGAYYINSAWPQ